LFYSSAQAEEQYAYTYIKQWGDNYIQVKSVSSGKFFDVRYSDPIGADRGDTLIIIFGNDRAKTIINQRTGKAATVTSFGPS
jgi:hypothetical protein